MFRPEAPKWYVRETSGMTHSLPFRTSGNRIHMSQSHIWKYRQLHCRLSQSDTPFPTRKCALSQWSPYNMTWRHRREVELYVYPYKSLVLENGGYSLPCPGKRPSTHCTGGLVGPRAGLDGCTKPRLYWVSNLEPSSKQRVTIPTELSWPPF
jgi:hypothetical protein